MYRIFKITFYSFIIFSIIDSSKAENPEFQNTNSYKYSTFDIDNSERQAFIYSELKNINKKVSLSKNRISIKNYLINRFKPISEIGNITILNEDNSTNYILEDKGLGGGVDLYSKVEKSDDKILILNSLNLKQGHLLNATGLFISDDKKLLVLAFVKQGSIDVSQVYFYDLVEQKLLNQNAVEIFSDELALYWIDGSQFYSEERIEGVDQIVLRDIRSLDKYSKVFTGLSNLRQIEVGGAKAYLLVDQNDMFTLSLNNTTVSSEITSGRIVSEKDESSFYYFQNKILKLLRITPSDLSNEDVFDLSNFLRTDLENVLIENDLLIGVENYAHSSSVHFFNLKNNDHKVLHFPNYLNVSSLEFSVLDNKKVISVSYSSDLVNDKYNWDYEKSQDVSVFNPDYDLLKNEKFNLEIETKRVFVKSFDGTMVPIKIVYKKGLELKNAPVIISTYGGFNSSGYLSAGLGSINREYIRRGLVIVGNGVRGGNELGDQWHDAASGSKKMKTYEDLASIAKWLIDTGVSSKEKIIIDGSSNGGLTVAATGLLFPQYFGLVIPHNGVLDLLSKEHLDKNFDNGWSYEYGDSRVPENYQYLNKISPLENIFNAKDGPQFLVINGRNDSRVNPAHSIKFVKAARDLGFNNVTLLSVANSGHFNTSPAYDDYKGYWAQYVKMLTIFDFLNLQF